MDRRAWVLGCTALWGTPGVAWAQAAARRRIAVLNSASAAGMRRDLVDQLREGLAELGWVDGRDIKPPGEIPFEQGTEFELVLHLGNAKALGLTVPMRVRVAADEVIE